MPLPPSHPQLSQADLTALRQSQETLEQIKPQMREMRNQMQRVLDQMVEMERAAEARLTNVAIRRFNGRVLDGAEGPGVRFEPIKKEYPNHPTNQSPSPEEITTTNRPAIGSHPNHISNGGIFPDNRHTVLTTKQIEALAKWYDDDFGIAESDSIEERRKK
ncbi:hypothetical protein HDU67_000983, partial [Dinochytrium kinnereticum]